MRPIFLDQKWEIGISEEEKNLFKYIHRNSKKYIPVNSKVNFSYDDTP
jgi:hypothetical protein